MKNIENIVYATMSPTIHDIIISNAVFNITLNESDDDTIVDVNNVTYIIIYGNSKNSLLNLNISKNNDKQIVNDIKHE